MKSKRCMCLILLIFASAVLFVILNFRSFVLIDFVFSKNWLFLWRTVSVCVSECACRALMKCASDGLFLLFHFFYYEMLYELREIGQQYSHIIFCGVICTAMRPFVNQVDLGAIFFVWAKVYEGGERGIWDEQKFGLRGLWAAPKPESEHLKILLEVC